MYVRVFTEYLLSAQTWKFTRECAGDNSYGVPI